jgi:hypothetical protein
MAMLLKEQSTVLSNSLRGFSGCRLDDGSRSLLLIFANLATLERIKPVMGIATHYNFSDRHEASLV